MGRHRAEPEVRRRGHRAEKQASGTPRSPELLAWGFFLSGTTALCLLWAQVSIPVTVGTSALLLAAFTTAWYASRGAARHPAPGPEAAEAGAEIRTGAVAVSAASTVPAPAPEPKGTLPAIPPAPVAAREFLTAPVPGTEASRWTRAFGPPDTGSLPLQPYVPAQHSTVTTAQSQDRRQRSHSSL